MADQDDINSQCALKALADALEAGLYKTAPEARLCKLLRKLDIKSAHPAAAFQMESLSATLNAVTFDMKHLSDWSKLKK